MAFEPGFRISLFDTAIIVAGIGGAIAAAQVSTLLAVLILFVVLQFFLFCNVFRVSRIPELLWAAGFLASASASEVMGVPSWPVTFAFGIVASLAVIGREMTHKSYHGIFWRRVNPGLKDWWREQNSS